MTARLLFCTLVAALIQHSAAIAADPAKDPRGWRNLSFGMTTKEVVAALGSQVTRRPSQEEQQLEAARRYAPIVLEDMQRMADVLLEDNDTPTEPAVRALRNARNTMRDARKNRTWVTTNGSGRASLEKVQPSDQNAALHLSGPRGAPLVVYQNSLDKGSAKMLQSVLDATNTIRTFKDEAQKAASATAVEEQDIRPSDLLFLPVTEIGYQFSPELLFGPRFSGVVMTLVPDTDGKQRFVAQDAYDLMARSLAKNLGKPDEASANDGGRRTAWEFPETIVTLALEVRQVDVPQYDSAQQMTVARTITSYPITLSYEKRQ
jgi:hypothetical protein